MTISDNNISNKPAEGSGSLQFLLVGVAAVSAIVATYTLANSTASFESRTGGFAGIVAGFVVICILLYIYQERGVSGTANDRESQIEMGLRSLDEANEFFAGSIRSSDMFRLVSSRIRELISFRNSELLLLNEMRSGLRVVEEDGPDASWRRGHNIEFADGLAGQSFSSGRVLIGLSALDTQKTNCHLAVIPLLHDAEVFGLLQLDFDEPDTPNEKDVSLFEAIGARVAPLVLSSIALERSISNALTDATTDLPNERSFFLILENQVAEAQRKGDDRPLTILAIDIKNFDDINQSFGHAAGDRVLNFVAQIIKDSLRQMDFFARSSNDEFLVILPTAAEEMAHEIIARIETSFFARKLELNDANSIEIELNFGWAAFGPDGETPDQILVTARLRKEQSKSIEPRKVLWFPQELPN